MQMDFDLAPDASRLRRAHFFSDPRLASLLSTSVYSVRILSTCLRIPGKLASASASQEVQKLRSEASDICTCIAGY